MMRKMAGCLTKNRGRKDQKSLKENTHENEHIKPRNTFCRNSKQFLGMGQVWDYVGLILFKMCKPIGYNGVLFTKRMAWFTNNVIKQL